nr:HepT-like ribonuclease domain-containing protein [uncultured Arsenicibacter sp.]
MPHSLEKYLKDILIAIEDIYSFLGDEPDYDRYNQNLMLQYAVERALGIIGEATNHAGRLRPDIEISHLRQIVNLRNIVIHAYDGVDNQVIWGVVIGYLPILKEEVSILLEQSTPDETN